MTLYTKEQLDLYKSIIEDFKQTRTPPALLRELMRFKLVAVTANQTIVSYPDPMSLEILKTRVIPILNASLQSAFKNEDVKYIDETQVEASIDEIESSNLDPTLTFENFVVGGSNTMAYMAALAVAENPATAYNPLFIYSDVGLGKTHLMNAIGNYIREGEPDKRVLLTTSENFMNDLLVAIRNRGQETLRRKMRSVDVLMVDDIQFIQKTEAMQEEFFHTFNDLKNMHKQIVVTSDRPPRELPLLEERLRSRFEMGMIIDIRKPDFETRVAILTKKAEEEQVEIPYDVIEFIAENFTDSIRQLEGALKRVASIDKLLHQPITLENASLHLKDLIKKAGKPTVNFSRICEILNGRFALSDGDLTGKKRTQSIAMPRQIGMYLCQKLLNMTTTDIGRAFGGRDHTTVMHGVKKVEEMIENDIAFRNQVDEIVDRIRGN